MNKIDFEETNIFILKVEVVRRMFLNIYRKRYNVPTNIKWEEGREFGVFVYDKIHVLSSVFFYVFNRHFAPTNDQFVMTNGIFSLWCAAACIDAMTSTLVEIWITMHTF
tara:strand:+ start:106 stop:432 length:327 start_codon:yes stop_codon:yes gene_type:complete